MHGSNGTAWHDCGLLHGTCQISSATCNCERPNKTDCIQRRQVVNLTVIFLYQSYVRTNYYPVIPNIHQYPNVVDPCPPGLQFAAMAPGHARAWASTLAVGANHANAPAWWRLPVSVLGQHGQPTQPGHEWLWFMRKLNEISIVVVRIITLTQVPMLMVLSYVFWQEAKGLGCPQGWQLASCQETNHHVDAVRPATGRWFAPSSVKLLVHPLKKNTLKSHKHL